MPEFRAFDTDELDQDSDSDFNLENFIDRVITNVQNDPQLQAELAESMDNPELLRFIAPGIKTDTQPQQQPQPAETDVQEPQPQPEVRTVTEKPDPDQLIGFVEEIIEYKSEDMTLGEVKEWAEENPQMVQTAIDLKL